MQENSVSKTEKFITRAKLKHNNFYSYDKTIYIKTHNKVIITCPVHGDFEQKPNDHLQGYGCKNCGIESKKMPKEKFIEESNRLHNNFYSYEKVIYINTCTKVIITCPKHGDFEQKPNDHLQASGCRKCVDENNGINLRSTKEDFINKANEIHNNFYSYEKVDYIRTHDKVIISCPSHGDFEQKPNNHLQGNGCRKCKASISNKELEVLDYVKSIYSGVVENSKWFKHNKKRYELDIFIPEFNLGIEYNGNYWHTETKKGKSYHYDKTKFFKELNIDILHIYSHEWKYKQDIVKNIIKARLNKRKSTLDIRKYTVKEVPKEEEIEFLNNYHLAGYNINSSICIGLYYGNNLLALQSFNKDIHSIELLRIANKPEIQVLKNHEKIFKYFFDNYNSEKMNITTYCDNCLFTEGIYIELGFKLLNEIDPSYFYINENDDCSIYNKENLEKDKLKDLFPEYYKEDLSEYEIMKLAGFNRVWDSGSKIFIFKSIRLKSKKYMSSLKVA